MIIHEGFLLANVSFNQIILQSSNDRCQLHCHEEDQSIQSKLGVSCLEESTFMPPGGTEKKSLHIRTKHSCNHMQGSPQADIEVEWVGVVWTTCVFCLVLWKLCIPQSLVHSSHLRPSLLRFLQFPTVSGNSCNSLCWSSRNTSCVQLPISAER